MNSSFSLERKFLWEKTIPKDIELLNSPWGFYKFLGVQRDASPEDVHKAYRELAKRLHPDAGGNEKDFKNLGRVVEILLHDGGELGPEHSKRRHYDEVSSLNSYFDGFIERGDERTGKLSEIMLIRMQAQREEAEVKHNLRQSSPAYLSLEEYLQRLKSPETESTRNEEFEEMIEGAMQNIRFEARYPQPEVHERLAEDIRQFIAKQAQFKQTFIAQPDLYSGKILDVFYRGQGSVTFGSPAQMRFGLVRHEETEHILTLVLEDDCYIAGFNQVHFKAEKADVNLTNPNVEGIFYVVNGNIRVNYETSSYGNVIRARAPTVNAISGFVRKGDLYVPVRFATDEWWERKPAVDIAVQDGTISLALRSPTIAPKDDPYGIKLYSLEKILGSYSKILGNSYKMPKNEI